MNALITTLWITTIQYVDAYLKTVVCIIFPNTDIIDVTLDSNNQFTIYSGSIAGIASAQGQGGGD